jgi:hypothetical protein
VVDINARQNIAQILCPLTIEQRRDEKAQMSHVPKRFWQDMCEMQADLL